MRASFARRSSQVWLLFPGLITATLVGRITAQFLSDHYGAPAMLMALLLGLALNFLSEDGSRTAPGIVFAARTVLRLGVALLGARVSVEMLGELGAPLIALTVAGVGATILCGLMLARLMGRDWRFGLLTGGIKTSLARILDVGPLAIILLVMETLFIGTFILTGLLVLGSLPLSRCRAASGIADSDFHQKCSSSHRRVTALCRSP